MIRTLTVAALAIAATVIPVAAMAQPEITVRGTERSYTTEDSFKTYVSYRGIDLASADGRDSLKSLVRDAARDGCDGLYAPQPLNQTMEERGMCFRDSLSRAMPLVDQAIQLAANGQSSGGEIAVAFSR